MPTKSRRKNSPVIEHLQAFPYKYHFTQAVRLLERSTVFSEKDQAIRHAKPVARFVPPYTEVVRFHSNNSLSFPSSEIDSIEINEESGNDQWNMNVNIMGLTGAMGIMPHHYTETILARHKQKDKSLSHFLDLFNHRIISLFFQASSKYNLPIEYERKKLNPPILGERESQTQALLSLIGMGTRHLTNRHYTNDESLVYYSGLFTQQIRTCANLKQILQNHFNIPVEIKEFIGQWQELIDDVRTKLPSETLKSGRNNCLGKSVMLGSHGWFSQGKIRIILGPLNSNNINSFAPGTQTMKAVNEIVRFYTRLEHDYDFVIRIKRTDIPNNIRLDKKSPTIIGWNALLSSKNKSDYNINKTFDIVVSANRVN